MIWPTTALRIFFVRDDEGICIELRVYFAAFSINKLTDEDTLFHLQRLVASKTYQSLVRLYAEADPALARILRNIKGSIHTHKSFVETDRFGEPHVAPSLCEGLEHLETFDATMLEEKLLQLVDGDEFIPEALGKSGSAETIRPQLD